MREPGLPSLDQLRVFVAVIDAGGFANAARLLQRTQSVISYAIASLEEQLNVVLLDRGKRKPVLTEAGKALLADARAVAGKVDGLRARARALAGGMEATVSLVVDVLFPAPVLVAVLEAFKRTHPTVTLRLHTDAPYAVAQRILEGTCQIGVGGDAAAHDALQRRGTGHVTMLAVAAPGHPLAQWPVPLPATVLRDYTQLTLAHGAAPAANPGGAESGPGAGMADWQMADPGAFRALLLAGLGWGYLPQALARDDLENGRMVRLALVEGAQRDYPMHVLQRTDEQAGPAGTWLMDRFAEQLPALRQRGY